LASEAQFRQGLPVITTRLKMAAVANLIRDKLWNVDLTKFSNVIVMNRLDIV
jgi:hypothetical protein